MPSDFGGSKTNVGIALHLLPNLHQPKLHLSPRLLHASARSLLTTNMVMAVSYFIPQRSKDAH
jgi:hypothetical protein